MAYASHTLPDDQVGASSVDQIEGLARARGDVLINTARLNGDDLAQTADELVQLADNLVQVSTARSHFMSKVAHELRTPLTIAKGWIGMLRYGELSSEHERVVKVVDQQIDELTRLVSDLLDLSQREADTLDLHLEITDICAFSRAVGRTPTRIDHASGHRNARHNMPRR